MTFTLERRRAHEIASGDVVRSQRGLVLVESWRWVVGNGLIVDGIARRDGAAVRFTLDPDDVVFLRRQVTT